MQIRQWADIARPALARCARRRRRELPREGPAGPQARAATASGWLPAAGVTAPANAHAYVFGQIRINWYWAVATGSPHPKARGKGPWARLRGASVWVLAPALLVGPGSRMASLQPRQTARPRPECRPRPWHVHALQQWAWPSPGAPAAACAGCCWCRGGAASRARGLAARRGTGSNCAHRGAWRKDGPGECVPRLLPY